MDKIYKKVVGNHKNFKIMMVMRNGEVDYYQVFDENGVVSAKLASEEVAKMFIDRGYELGVDWSKYYM